MLRFNQSTAHCRTFCFFFFSLHSSALPHWRCRSAARVPGTPSFSRAQLETQRCVPSAGCSQAWPGLCASPAEQQGQDALCSCCIPVAPKCEAPSGQISLLLLCTSIPLPKLLVGCSRFGKVVSSAEKWTIQTGNHSLHWIPSMLLHV